MSKFTLVFKRNVLYFKAECSVFTPMKKLFIMLHRMSFDELSVDKVIDNTQDTGLTTSSDQFSHKQ